MSWLFEPRVFLIVITVLFAAAAVRYAIAGNWAEAGYSACAAGLQLCVMGMGK
jgi:hypothetical protein